MTLTFSDSELPPAPVEAPALINDWVLSGCAHDHVCIYLAGPLKGSSALASSLAPTAPKSPEGEPRPTTATLTQALLSGTREAERTLEVPWPPAWVLTALEPDCVLQSHGIQASLLSAEWHCHLDPKVVLLIPCIHLSHPQHRSLWESDFIPESVQGWSESHWPEGVGGSKMDPMNLPSWYSRPV